MTADDAVGSDAGRGAPNGPARPERADPEEPAPEPAAPEPGDPEPAVPEAAGPEPAGGVSEAERRRRRAAVFGDVLPDVTRDERGDPGRAPDQTAGDEWLRRQVPPHHG